MPCHRLPDPFSCHLGAADHNRAMHVSRGLLALFLLSSLDRRSLCTRPRHADRGSLSGFAHLLARPGCGKRCPRTATDADRQQHLPDGYAGLHMCVRLPSSRHRILTGPQATLRITTKIVAQATTTTVRGPRSDHGGSTEVTPYRLHLLRQRERAAAAAAWCPSGLLVRSLRSSPLPCVC